MSTFSCPDMNALDGGFVPPRAVSIVEKPYLKAEKAGFGSSVSHAFLEISVGEMATDS